MNMAQEIGEAANAAEYVRRKRANKEPVMGFGHRVYRAEDPRARHMRAGVEKLSREMGQPKWYQILEALVKAMERYARHGVNVNVDFYAGVVYYLNGIPPTSSCRSSPSAACQAGQCRCSSRWKTTS